MEEEKKEDKAVEVATKEVDTATIEKEVEVPAKFKDLVSKIEEMTVLELSELVKVLEDKFGVSAAAPMMVAATGAADGEGGGDEAPSTVSVELTEGGGTKIAVIKALRQVTELGLREAKDLVDGAPVMVKEGISREEGEELKKTLEEAGATITLK